MTAQQPPEPKSLLGRHRVLSPTAAVHVSPLCLGVMNFGEAWKNLMGECTQENAFAMMDYFYEQGGNFIDTCATQRNAASCLEAMVADIRPTGQATIKCKSRKSGLENG